jgi:hypothetical protein
MDLGRTIEAMIRDGIARQKKGGKYSKSSLTSSMSGFLHELPRHLAGIPERAS